MTDLILSLLRTGGNRTTEELTTELGILWRNCRPPELADVTDETLRAALDTLVDAGRIQSTPAGWEYCRTAVLKQGTLFGE